MLLLSSTHTHSTPPEVVVVARLSALAAILCVAAFVRYAGHVITAGSWNGT